MLHATLIGPGLTLGVGGGGAGGGGDAGEERRECFQAAWYFGM